MPQNMSSFPMYHIDNSTCVYYDILEQNDLLELKTKGIEFPCSMIDLPSISDLIVHRLPKVTDCDLHAVCLRFLASLRLCGILDFRGKLYFAGKSSGQENKFYFPIETPIGLESLVNLPLEFFAAVFVGFFAGEPRDGASVPTDIQLDSSLVGKNAIKQGVFPAHSMFKVFEDGGGGVLVTDGIQDIYWFSIELFEAFKIQSDLSVTLIDLILEWERGNFGLEFWEWRNSS
jgi:hypothetical protein